MTGLSENPVNFTALSRPRYQSEALAAVLSGVDRLPRPPKEVLQ